MKGKTNVPTVTTTARKKRALLVLEDVEVHYWNRINTLKDPKDRLRLTILLINVMSKLENIEK